MLPPCSGRVRRATVSGTPLNERSLASTLTSCRPLSRYSGATWLAISCAPAIPLEFGFHDDHGGGGVSVDGPMIQTAMPTRAAMPTATSPPVRNWKRGEYDELPLAPARAGAA